MASLCLALSQVLGIHKADMVPALVELAVLWAGDLPQGDCGASVRMWVRPGCSRRVLPRRGKHLILPLAQCFLGRSQSNPECGS